jgi:hypothetical protein
MTMRYAKFNPDYGDVSPYNQRVAKPYGDVSPYNQRVAKPLGLSGSKPGSTPAPTETGANV